MRMKRGLSVLMIGLFPVAACAHMPRAPTRPVAEDGFTELVPIERPGVDEDPAQELRVLSGDVLAVELVSYRSPSTPDRSMYEGIVVDEVGIVHVPLAGGVRVGGMTLDAAETAIEEAIREFDRSVQVNIRIAEYNGHSVTVLGSVLAPGRVPATPGIRLADLLALVGGPILDRQGQMTIFLADLGSAQLMRGGEMLPVDLEKAMLGDPRHNVRIRAGDYLYIPPSRGNSIVLLGEVAAPTVLPYLPQMRLTEALAFAGGVTADGDRGDIRIVRGDLDSPRVYQTNLKSLVNNNQTDVILAPGDIVFVEDEPLVAWRSALEVIQPVLAAANLGLLSWNIIQQNEIQRQQIEDARAREMTPE